MQLKCWPLYLVLPGRYGGFLTALLILAVLWTLFLAIAPTALTEAGAIFYGTIVAYIIPVFAYSSRITEQAVGDLRPLLDMNDDEFETFQQSIAHRGLGMQFIMLAVGVVGGLVQILVINPDWDSIPEHYRMQVMVDIVGSIIVWIVMTTVIWSLISNATRVGLLARRLQMLDLYRMDQLLPFARVAIASTLAVFGALALFPLLYLHEEATFSSSVPGLISITVPLAALLTLPIWPAHRRIKAAKQAARTRINERIGDWRSRHPGEPEAEGLSEINQLLTLRRHLDLVSDWPLDMGTLGRLLLYMIIPPLTWVGAALIENVVDALL